MKSTIIITSVIFVMGIITIPVVFSDDDWDEYRQKSTGVANVNNATYKEECGSCHMAYPAGLLPSASWQKMMLNLENHFGDNAEIDTDANKIISEYLLANGADRSEYRRSRKIMNTLGLNSVPERITEIPYIKHEHDEIPTKMVVDNKEVRSFSHCNACHSKAEQGQFDEDNVRIPNYGRWDD